MIVDLQKMCPKKEPTINHQNWLVLNSGEEELSEWFFFFFLNPHRKRSGAMELWFLTALWLSGKSYMDTYRSNLFFLFKLRNQGGWCDIPKKWQKWYIIWCRKVWEPVVCVPVVYTVQIRLPKIF